MDKHLVYLRDWMIIKISGPESFDYLNGIITVELANLKPNEVRRAAFLTPKAKIRSVFWITNTEEGYLLNCGPKMKEALVEDLLKYKLSMDVKLEDITNEVDPLYLIPSSESKIPGLSNDRIAYDFVNLVLEDQDTKKLLADRLGSSTPNIVDYSTFTTILVEHGILPPEPMEGHNPYELGTSDMIALEKGCFLGQEPLSRMYYRGRPRKFIYHIKANDPIEKSSINLNHQEVGEVLVSSSAGNTNYGIAYISRDIEKFSDLDVNSQPIEVLQRIGTYPKIWLN